MEKRSGSVLLASARLFRASLSRDLTNAQKYFNRKGTGDARWNQPFELSRSREKGVSLIEIICQMCKRG